MEAFYDIQNPWAKELEEKADIIRTELENLLETGDRGKWTFAHPEYVQTINRTKSWKTFTFRFFGINHLENRALCPQTSDIIESIPEVISAEFSLLHPQTHILPHKGYSRMILRNHLALIVPEGNLGLRVADETRTWKHGKVLSFSDHLEHEAWNKTDELRAVLMFDIPHPETTYSAPEICQYKLEHLSDPFLLEIAPKDQWLAWLKQGYLP